MIEVFIRLMGASDDFIGPVNIGNPVEFTDLKFDFNVDHGVRWVEKK